MTCLGRGDGTPLTLGHTCLPEMDWHLITRESPDFNHGECQKYIAQKYGFITEFSLKRKNIFPIESKKHEIA